MFGSFSFSGLLVCIVMLVVFLAILGGVAYAIATGVYKARAKYGGASRRQDRSGK